jgi:para-nitrobenzyl esterase
MIAKIVRQFLLAGLGRLAAIVTVASIGFSIAAAAATPTVTTTTGTFTGVNSTTRSGVEDFFGIRYAAPPVGALRWAPPQAPTPPSGTTVASSIGNICPQPDPLGTLAMAEDCLFLHVHVPASAKATSALPVYVWIHGGSLITGAGALYNPDDMVAEDNIIVVTINYRLGVLGFLAEPGLTAAAADDYENVGDSGNYGLMDQQFALKWVQSNIAKFGGDPKKVTVGGESAGGFSVSSLLASTNTAKGLFRGAIIESGSYGLYSTPTQAAYAAGDGAAIDAAVGCTPPADAACLRSVSMANLLTAQVKVFGSEGISADTGTKIMPQTLQAAFAAGNIIKVPVLQGTNANEGRLFEPTALPLPAALATVAAAGGPANYDLTHASAICPTSSGAAGTCSYSQEVNLFLDGLWVPSTTVAAGFGTKVAAAYPLSNFPDPYLTGDKPSADEALAQIIGDFIFACTGTASNSDLSKWVSVFGYEFDDPKAPPTPLIGGTVIKAPNDAYGYPTASEHGSEIAFLFTCDTCKSSSLSKDELHHQRRPEPGRQSGRHDLAEIRHHADDAPPGSRPRQAGIDGLVRRRP